jgi:dTMP kinase
VVLLSKGKLYIIEGPDHSGKSTGLNFIKSYIKENRPYMRTIFTREPGGNNIALCEKIREILLDPQNEISDITEAYLYASSRAEHVNHIKKWLDEGYDVFTDRFVYSSYVYQGVARGLGIDKIISINKEAISDLFENYNVETIFYKIDVETYLRRKNNQLSLDRLEQNDLDFFKKVINGYDDLFEKLSNSGQIIHYVDATKKEKDVNNQLKEYLKI